MSTIVSPHPPRQAGVPASDVSKDLTFMQTQPLRLTNILEKPNLNYIFLSSNLHYQIWRLQEHNLLRLDLSATILHTRRNPKADLFLLCSVLSPVMVQLARYIYTSKHCEELHMLTLRKDMPSHLIHHKCFPRRVHPHRVSSERSPITNAPLIKPASTTTLPVLW
jgi:hypothetical protein